MRDSNDLTCLTASSRAAPERLVPSIRSATADDAVHLHRLIAANVETGRLLPRTLDDLVEHARRFVVVIVRGSVVGCAELAPLSGSLAEVRSLVVQERHRGAGLGRYLVEALTQRARRGGYRTLCAFTHDPAPFGRMGFTAVPRARFPEKIATDCHACPHLAACRQQAMAFDL